MTKTKSTAFRLSFSKALKMLKRLGPVRQSPCARDSVKVASPSQHTPRSRPVRGRNTGCDPEAKEGLFGAQLTKSNPLKKAATCIASASLAVSLISSSMPPPAAAVTTEQLLFLEAWRAVDRAYVDKGFNGQSWFRVREKYLKEETMDNRQQTYDAIIKLLSSLDDRFTRFLTPDRLSALRRGTSGSVTGVGVEVTYPQDSKEKDLVVVTPFPGGPAELAGVNAGDSIVAIDGTPTQGLSLYDASDLLLGEEGSKVILTLRHSGSRTTEEVSMTRAKLIINPVSFTFCPEVSPSVGPAGASGPLGYIRIATFNSNTVQAFKEALLSLKEQGVQRLVLDIRNNGGGLFPAGVQVARSLIQTGDIVLIADANGVRDIYSADGLALDTSTPLSVLVNQGTASASEVLSGALQDSRRATIVGPTRTFGKGLIQSIVDLSDGSGVAVTVARYQTPAGIDINKIGITPDLTIKADAVPIAAASKDAKFCSVLQSDQAPKLFK